MVNLLPVRAMLLVVAALCGCSNGGGGSDGGAADAAAACRPEGSLCTGGSQCCGLRCLAGYCEAPSCLALGRSCGAGASGACCSDNCVSGVCVPSGCTAQGQPCTVGTQCCSGDCAAGACTAVVVCQDPGGFCVTASDCCSMRCNTGTQQCQDPVVCVAVGQPCGVTDVCCLGRQCAGGSCQ